MYGGFSLNRATSGPKKVSDHRGAIGVATFYFIETFQRNTPIAQALEYNKISLKRIFTCSLLERVCPGKESAL